MVGGVGVLHQSAQVEGDKMQGDQNTSEVQNEVGTKSDCVQKLRNSVMYMNISSLQYKNQEK